MIVNNRRLAPYIEAVNFSSQNIDQKKLGTILGIFEIKDTSEDSAYIVNFLASVAKKTYFASHHKTALESFESTLYRLNLSLSEVAKHGNVNWIGKVDAVICSINDEEIHFSVSGDAKVLLLRDGRLTEISNGLSPQDEAVNPIKTFTDIASGKIESNDKLIITTDDISHVFTLADLEKHSLSFAKKEFLRFLETALVNELDIAGTIVVDINEKVVEVKNVSNKKPEEDEDKLIEQSLNAFSNKTFEEVASKKRTTIEEVTDADQEDENEYTHKKTGHIYIKDPEEKSYKPTADGNLQKITINCKEGMARFYFWIKDRYLKKGSYQVKKRLSPGISNVRNRTGHFFRDVVFAGIIKLPKSAGMLLSNTFITIGNLLKKVIPEKPREIDVEIKNEMPVVKANKLKKIKKAVSKILPGKRKVSGIITPETSIPKKEIRFIGQRSKSPSYFLKKITPNFSKVTNYFSQMDKKHKFYALGIVALIIIAPVILSKIKDKKNEIITEVNEERTNQEEMAVNPSSVHYAGSEKIYSGENILGVLSFGENVFIISKDKIVKTNTRETEDFSLPNYTDNIKNYSFMDDLNLVFIISNNNKLVSFSPISGKFSENSINIPENSEISAIGTYLTYIYLVDSKNNQIYRYPRAEGGFGEKTDWLREDINLENVTSMAIDENIYLVQNNTPVKFSNGKKEEFSLNKNGKLVIKNLFTNDDLKSIYVIDKQNGELIKFKKDGSTESYHSNQNLLEAINFWIDEENDLSYFSTKNEVFKMKSP